MLSFCFVPGTFISLCLLLTMSFALPSRFESASSPAATRRDISPSKIFDDLSAGPIGFSQNKPTIDPIISLQPGWPVACRSIRDPIAHPPNEADCIHISTEIESSEGAESFRVFSADAGILVWAHSNCVVTMGAARLEYTDVFKPILIAQSIRHVVDVCLRRGLGGVTEVGPRRKFVLVVSNYIRFANDTVAIE